MIIIGLGNPGEQFENTPHNIGFDAIDEFAKKNDFPEFSLEKKANALISKKGKILLAKPQTFMNDSGKTARVVAKLEPKKDLVVIHDDKDLPLGRIKIIKNGGSAGHKGVESIIKAIGNKNLIRIKIGTATKKKMDAMAMVLKKFTPDQQKEAKKISKKVADALDCLIKEGLDKAMNEFNR